MATEIQHDNAKFALAGLDLNVPVDLVPATKYSVVTNVVSKIEGQLQTRDGITPIATVIAGIPIHTIFRLTQANPVVMGERLVGLGSFLYTAALPQGSSFAQLINGPTYDGLPLSIIQFQFDADPAIWAIIANSAGMMKRRAGYYQVLGVAPPTVQATASAGSSGLLNSSSGTPYDWRYTYLNPVTQSESNGSPTSTASSEAKSPTSTSAPDPQIGGPAFGTVTNTSGSQGVTGTTASCRWKGFTAATGSYSSLKLSVTIFTTSSFGGTAKNAWVQYSTDNGTTWTQIFQTSGTTASKVYTISLPTGTNLTQVLLRAYVASVTGSMAISLSSIGMLGVFTNPTTTTLALSNQSANVCVTPPVDPQETSIRLYRRGGTLPDNWFQVGEYAVSSLVQGSCGSGTLLINDNIPDSTIEVNPILPQDNFQPVQSVQAVNFPLPVIFGPAAGRVLACGDPARPAAVYFSNNGNADLWGAENWINVANPGEQIMNGINYALRTFAFSRERMYIMLPNIIAGVTFTPAETSCRRGLKGRWALAAGEQGIYFVSKDGVYRTQGGPEQSIIDDSIRPLFPTREAPQGTPTNGYDAIDMSQEDLLHLAYHNGEVWFYYQGLTTGIQQLLIYDERRSRWRPGSYRPTMMLAYSEPNTTSSMLFGGIDGTLYAAGGTDDNGQTIPVTIQTGAFDQGRPLNLKEYLTINVDLDPGGATTLNPIIIAPFMNGNTLGGAAIQVTGTGRQRVSLPLNQLGQEIYAYNLSFYIAWAAMANLQPVLYQYEVLYRNEPAEVTHWELPQEGLGMEGWFHIRDIYMVLRSNADVTLTVTPGVGAVQTFTLPNTNGAKNTIYVQLSASKANSYGFALDSAKTFRAYSDEIEVRCKQWLTNLGYKNIPIIAREQVGRPFGQVNV